MHSVLGGQVRFNIRFRQVGAQATPPLCSVQLWYTFPSGHSPTSTLSGSTVIKHTNICQNQCTTETATTENMRLLISASGTHSLKWHFVVRTNWNRNEGGCRRLPFSSGSHSIFPFLHRLVDETWKERERCLWKRIVLSNTGSVQALSVSFDNHSSL